MDLTYLFRCIELDIRSSDEISKNTWEQLYNINDWEFRICEGFIRDVRLAIQRNDLTIQYKKWDFGRKSKFNETGLDLLIATIKRDQRDTVLCDVTNRLVIPPGIKHDRVEVWGMNYVEGRNFCVKKALEMGANYLLFIDDDMIVENTALIKLWETIQTTNRLVVAADYQKKAEYSISAHGEFTPHLNPIEEEYKDKDGNTYLYETDLCAMGFTLMNIKHISYNVPSPIFWAFNAPDGLWAMGEDAFFTKNLLHYTKEKPVIDTRPSILHYDKFWKKTFGKRNPNITYATEGIEDFVRFDFLRQPPKNPILNVCIPVRSKEDAIATDLSRLLCLRGYRVGKGIDQSGGLIPGPLVVDSLPVDDARNTLAKEAVRSGSELMLFIDNDVILPEDGLVKMMEVMENDTEHQIGMVVGDYLLKGKVPHSAHLQLNKNGIVTEFNRIKSDNNKIEANWLCGLGCALIRTEVFRQIRYPWFLCYSTKLNRVGIAKEEDGGVNEDAHFSELLFESGYKIMMLKDVQCLHVDFKNQLMFGYQDKFNPNYFACFDWSTRFKYVSPSQVSKQFEGRV